MNNNIHNDIADMRYRLDRLEAQVLEAEVNNTQAPTDPEVQQAAEALARAIAKSQGVDVPVGGGNVAGNLPILELPEEFMKYGGIGIGVIMAKPQQTPEVYEDEDEDEAYI